MKIKSVSPKRIEYNGNMLRINRRIYRCKSFATNVYCWLALRFYGVYLIDLLAIKHLQRSEKLIHMIQIEAENSDILSSACVKGQRQYKTNNNHSWLINTLHKIQSLDWHWPRENRKKKTKSNKLNQTFYGEHWFGSSWMRSTTKLCWLWKFSLFVFCFYSEWRLLVLNGSLEMRINFLKRTTTTFVTSYAILFEMVTLQHWIVNCYLFCEMNNAIFIWLPCKNKSIDQCFGYATTKTPLHVWWIKERIFNGQKIPRKVAPLYLTPQFQS